MPKKHKDGKPKRREVVFSLDCPCGRQHQLRLARGEAQVTLRAIETGKPLSFRPRHIVLEQSRKPPE
jgi:hypothetical protein